LLRSPPGAIADPAEIVRRGELAVAAQPNAARYRHTLAVAHYRAGQFHQAVEQCQESKNVGASWGGNVVNWLLLAMAHHRLGHSEEVQKWLDKAENWIDKVSRLPSWCDRFEVQLLRREAEELLGVKKQKD
jgi:hypothetical protein